MELKWDIYEIQSTEDVLHGVMLRGRIRKFTIENNLPCLTENASDKENVVRFALLTGSEPEKVIAFTQKILPDAKIEKVMDAVENPVLSKMKVNDTSRYSIQ